MNRREFRELEKNRESFLKIFLIILPRSLGKIHKLQFGENHLNILNLYN